MTSWSLSSRCGIYKLIECIIKEICHGVKQNAKICAIGETASEEMVEREKRED